MSEYVVESQYAPFVFRPNKKCLTKENKLHHESEFHSSATNAITNTNNDYKNRVVNNTIRKKNENKLKSNNKFYKEYEEDTEHRERRRFNSRKRNYDKSSQYNKSVIYSPQNSNCSCNINSSNNDNSWHNHLPSLNGRENVYAYGKLPSRELTLDTQKIYNCNSAQRQVSSNKPLLHIAPQEEAKQEREQRLHVWSRLREENEKYQESSLHTNPTNFSRNLEINQKTCLNTCESQCDNTAKKKLKNSSVCLSKNRDIAKVLQTKPLIKSRLSSCSKKTPSSERSRHDHTTEHKRDQSEVKVLRQETNERAKQLTSKGQHLEKDPTLPTLPSLSSTTRYVNIASKRNLRTSSKLLSFCNNGKESSSMCDHFHDERTNSPTSMGLSNGVSLSSNNTVMTNEHKLIAHTPSPMHILYHLNTYEEEEIREYLPHVYFTGRENCKKINAIRDSNNNDGFDDEKSHYLVVLGDHIAYRYEILRELGKGTFGTVVCAYDHKRGKEVAIKIIKNKPSYLRQAEEEVKLLAMLRNDDPYDQSNIVRMLSSFMFRRHYIIAFELLKQDVYNLCQFVKFKPFTLSFIAHFAKQVLIALQFVRQHHIIHCDIKPENIVFVEDVCSSNHFQNGQFHIKLIDFGSACLENKQLYTYIQSRYYRAPEIVLGIPYTPAIDMWSFGCVLCELANGFPIFPATTEIELLERIFEYLGHCPLHLQEQGKRTGKFFSEDGNFRLDALQSNKNSRRTANGRSIHAFVQHAPGSESERLYFVDFIARCLQYDPAQRMTPEQGLQHPWLQVRRSNYANGLTANTDNK